MRRRSILKKRSQRNPTKQLMLCASVWSLASSIFRRTEDSENAAQLLCGIPDKKIEEKGLRQGTDLVALSSFEISASLPYLLSCRWCQDSCVRWRTDPDEASAHLNNDANLFVGTSLERAYLWALSCKAALRKELKFGDWKFKINPKELQAGRIFPSDNTESVQTEGLSFRDFLLRRRKRRRQNNPSTGWSVFRDFTQRTCVDQYHWHGGRGQCSRKIRQSEELYRQTQQKTE